MVRLILLCAFSLCCVDGLNLILQQPEVINQMKGIKEKEKFSYRQESKLEGQTFHCEAISKSMNLGQGQDLTYLSHNVGKCIKTPLLNHGAFKLSVCPSSHLCLSFKGKMNNVMTLTGLLSASSAIQCKCVDPRKSCQRLLNFQVYHSGTIYEKSVDVGRCLGECHTKRGYKRCQAISMIAVNINGANGAQCIKKITKCACTRRCYRVSHRQTFKTLHFDQTTKTNKTEDVVIDVGRCQGRCRSKKRKDTCIFWIKQKSYANKARMVCLFKSLKRDSTRCLPRVFKSRTIRGADGYQQTINIVKRCGCQ